MKPGDLVKSNRSDRGVGLVLDVRISRDGGCSTLTVVWSTGKKEGWSLRRFEETHKVVQNMSRVRRYQ